MKINLPQFIVIVCLSMMLGALLANEIGPYSECERATATIEGGAK